jgi:hypothetical protein
MGWDAIRISEPTNQSNVIAQHGSNQPRRVAGDRRKIREIDPFDKLRGGRRSPLVVG